MTPSAEPGATVSSALEPGIRGEGWIAVAGGWNTAGGRPQRRMGVPRRCTLSRPPAPNWEPLPDEHHCETARRALQPVLEGARLSAPRQNRPDLRFPFPERFVERLTGATVLRLDRRAKYLLFPLSTGETWITHLGMTGRFTLEGVAPGLFETNAPVVGKHEHMSLTADRDGVLTRLGYADAPRFGFMGLIPTEA